MCLFIAVITHMHTLVLMSFMGQHTVRVTGLVQYGVVCPPSWYVGCVASGDWHTMEVFLVPGTCVMAVNAGCPPYSLD